MDAAAIFKMIVLNIRRIEPELYNEPIVRESMLSPLGLGSIERAELIEQTLEDLNLHVSWQEFLSAHNLGELTDLLARKLQVAKGDNSDAFSKKKQDAGI